MKKHKVWKRILPAAACSPVIAIASSIIVSIRTPTIHVQISFVAKNHWLGQWFKRAYGDEAKSKEEVNERTKQKG